jgi:DNA uptake protein ComE-like DNA-binding protein
MKKRFLVLSTFLALALTALPAVSQNAMQNAGTDTKNAAKDVGSATKTGTLTVADKVRDKIDINRAKKEDLMKLEGVGEATSNKIIAGRPYSSKRDLLTKKIVTKTTYNKISDQIVAHAVKPDDKK